MERVLDLLERMVCVILVAMLIVMLAVGTMQVMWRYVLQNSLSWSEELMRYMYVWVTMIGISIGIRKKGLASIATLADFLESKTKIGKHVISAIGFAFQLMVFILMVYYGGIYAGRSAVQLAPALQISMRYVYLAMPIGGVLSIVFTLEEIAGYIKNAAVKPSPNP